jgi:hypothetical protein
MCRIPHLVSILPIAILYTLSAAHQPDPTQLGANVLLRGSHGHFITRTADLFIEDNTSFDQPVAITQTPFVLRALAPYNMHLDPGWDQNGWDSDARQQKLTEPGATRLLVDAGPDLLRHSVTGDPVLQIDLAAVYDDNESDDLGGFWANWRIIVTPISFGPSGPVQADARFSTLLRGPFWSGEKLEVADCRKVAMVFHPSKLTWAVIFFLTRCFRWTERFPARLVMILIKDLVTGFRQV